MKLFLILSIEVMSPLEGSSTSPRVPRTDLLVVERAAQRRYIRRTQ